MTLIMHIIVQVLRHNDIIYSKHYTIDPLVDNEQIDIVHLLQRFDAHEVKVWHKEGKRLTPMASIQSVYVLSPINTPQ